MSDVLKTEKVEGRVAVLTVNRPDKMNALNGQVRCALVGALDELRDDPEVRAVVITGAGEKAFIAGADIQEFRGARPVDQHRSMEAGDIYSAVEAFPKPVIAMINGYCLGGGCELAMACDLRIASEEARLGQPEINLGIIPGGGGTQRLPRLVGEGQAMKMILTGDMVDAEEARKTGLVDGIHPAEDLREEALELARTIGEKSPVALKAAKQAIQASRRMPLDEGIKYERTWFSLLFSTEDKEEGVEAFLEKRDPEFTGK